MERTIRDLAKAVQTLNESVAALEKPLAELITATNGSSRLLERQTDLLREIREQLAMENARIGALCVATEASTEDPGIRALYQRLEKLK